MNCKLAKQLKDAGFPQGRQFGFGEVHKPTLDELIFAVDDLKFTILHDKDGWYAENDNGLSPSDCKSPEEAVAKLWLTTR